MEVYKREALAVIKRFLGHRLSFPDCIAALDASLARLIPRLLHEDLDTLRAVMLSNNEVVMKDMERRGTPGESQSRLLPSALEK